MSQQLGFFETGLCVLPPVGSLYAVKELEGSLGGIFSNQLDLTQLYVAIEQANSSPSDLKRAIYELGIEVGTFQMIINQQQIELSTFQNLVKDADQKTALLEVKIEMLEIQKVEMREAFRKVKDGKEKQLEDTHLIFFAKR